jgi:hypothetical protein
MGKVRDALIVGGNSTNRVHIRQHFEVYKERCEKDKIEVHHHALPRDMWREIYGPKDEEDDSGLRQSTLDGIVERSKPREFTPEGVLEAVAKFIVCDDQVSMY